MINKDIAFTVVPILVAVVIIGIIAIKILSNPVNKSVERIERDILNIMPLGTGLDDVIKVICDNEEWEVYYNGTWHSSKMASEERFKKSTIGTGHINIALGKFLLESTSVSLWFDKEELTLLKIEVKKTMAI